MIPKIIHYCWLSEDPVPQNLKDCMDSWKKKLPDYEFIKWDFTRFDKQKSEWVRDAFDNKKYAFAADYVRLYAIYNFGGIYMDMDIEVIKPFDELLNEPYMLAYERPSCNGIEAGCFGAEKGNEYIKACLDSYEGKHFIKEDGSFEQTPLPMIMKSVIDKNGFELKIYNHNYFTAKSYETGIVKVTDETFCVHHFAGSWKTDEEKEIIERTKKLTSVFGYKIARNMAEYYCAMKNRKIKGVAELTKRKLRKEKNK